MACKWVIAVAATAALATALISSDVPAFRGNGGSGGMGFGGGFHGGFGGGQFVPGSSFRGSFPRSGFFRPDIRADLRDIRRDRLDLRQDRRNLRRDLRRGNPAAIATDRADIRRDRVDLRRDFRDVRGDFW